MGIKRALMINFHFSPAALIFFTFRSLGYLWQPYYMTKLEQLKSACPNALELILEQRLELQVQGHLSSRQYPAVIISSNSGDYQGVTDFLDASIFSSFHPNGEPVECYILTCARGASRIRQRIFKSFPQLVDRMERMLIIVPNLIDSGNEVMTSMNIESVPKLLFDRLGIRIANHDGGQGVLRDFCRAGAIAQVNLTLCRNRSLKEVVSRYLLQDADTEDFDKRVKLFFSSSVATPPSKHRQMPRGTIPLNWTAICCVDDGGKNVAVVSFDTRAAGDFCHD